MPNVEGPKRAAAAHQGRPEVSGVAAADLARGQQQAPAVTIREQVEAGVNKSVLDSRPEVPKREVEESEQQQRPPITPEQVQRFRDFIMSSESRLAAEDRRKRIEADLTPLNLSDLVDLKELRQTVVIAAGFSATFRTWSADEEREVVRLLTEMKKDNDPDYMATLSSIFEVVLGVVALNGKELPTHLDEKRVFDRDRFNEKLAVLLSYPTIVVTDLGINLAWFRSRVEDLLMNPEQVKNG